METHTKIFVRMKNYRRCSYSFFAIGYFHSFAVPAIDIGYFCSHVGVGVSDTLADRSGQQYFCIVIVIGYSRSCDTIDIGEFGSYGVRAFIAIGYSYSHMGVGVSVTSADPANRHRRIQLL